MWLFRLVCVTFILIINEVDFVIRGLEAVTGGDIYVQSMCSFYRRCSSSGADTDD